MTDLPPYARLLDLRFVEGNDGGHVVMPFSNDVLGRPGFLHGGAIAGLLEFAAMAALYDAIDDEAKIMAKPINVSLVFMRGGRAEDTFASAIVTRLGKRVANVEAHAWQQERGKPIASAQMNMLLKRRAAD